MAADLKPCPFCGGKAAFVPRAVNIVLQKDPSDPKFGVSVICGKCGSESPNMVDEAHAAAKRNTRPSGVAACRWPDCGCHAPQGPGECRARAAGVNPSHGGKA